MSQIISIHSYRGGTGKSNLTANLATLLAKAGHRVGIIDTDIQSPGVHVIFALKPSEVTLALNDYLWGRCRIDEAAHDVTALKRVGEELGRRLHENDMHWWDAQLKEYQALPPWKDFPGPTRTGSSSGSTARSASTASGRARSSSASCTT